MLALVLVLVLVLVVVVVLLLLLPCSPSCSSGCRCRAFLVLLLLVAAPHVLNPHVSFEREIVFRNTSSCFPCALFSSKRHCSACCIKRGKRAGKRTPGAGGLSCGHSPTRRRAREGVVDAKPI